MIYQNSVKKIAASIRKRMNWLKNAHTQKVNLRLDPNSCNSSPNVFDFCTNVKDERSF